MGGDITLTGEALVEYTERLNRYMQRLERLQRLRERLAARGGAETDAA